MRHGHSLANLEKIIVSHPENGIDGYGLSDQGVAQVNNAGEACACLNDASMIVSSDFRRARESAEIMHRVIKCRTPINFDKRLRERYFGELELSADSNYAQVWRQDDLNSDNDLSGVESPNQVMKRVSALVAEHETIFSGATLLLVSHGDALQILQTAMSRQNASRHRSQQHINTAEIRELKLSAD